MEDYFQVNAFHRMIERGHWYRFESRFEQNAGRVLELLDTHKIKATFFVSGWIADHYPEIVRETADRGHEVASKGYYHRRIREMSPAEFREDLLRSRESVERASGRKVFGFRVSHGGFSAKDLWALDVLAEEGFAYDSSIFPKFRAFAGEPWRRFAHAHEHEGRTLWEIPISSERLLGCDVPIGGGNYFRQFPPWLLERAVARWDRTHEHPFVMYFHVWEIDPGQPKFSTAPLHTRLRHYRNLDRMTSVLESYFRTYRLESVASYLGLGVEPAAAVAAAGAGPPGPVEVDSRPAPAPTLNDPGTVETAVIPSPGRLPVSLVIPCYNEEKVLPYLANTLKSVLAKLGQSYDLRLIFVEDGSLDGTWDAIVSIFGDWPATTLVRQPENRGVAAAILTGIRVAETDVVCSIDCDCTYDPHQLAAMIPRLAEGVDLVTASPYHPEGRVKNVPGWRLWLSKSASFLYRQVLRQKLYTYTSCFRVYRREAVIGLRVSHGGFLGVTELLGEMDFQGSTIVEHPTTLEVRILGRSKMKTARTVVSHLGLLGRFARRRLRAGLGHVAIPLAGLAGPTDSPLVVRPRQELEVTNVP